MTSSSIDSSLVPNSIPQSTYVMVPVMSVIAENERLKQENERLKAELKEKGALVVSLQESAAAHGRQLATLLAENQYLREENESLKQRLSCVESELKTVTATLAKWRAAAIVGQLAYAFCARTASVVTSLEPFSFRRKVGAAPYEVTPGDLQGLINDSVFPVSAQERLKTVLHDCKDTPINSLDICVKRLKALRSPDAHPVYRDDGTPINQADVEAAIASVYLTDKDRQIARLLLQYVVDNTPPEFVLLQSN